MTRTTWMRVAGVAAGMLVVCLKGSGRFPGWDVAAGDNLLWSVAPQGGTLPSGVALGIRYSYTPN